jgi:hypothetical protein
MQQHSEYSSSGQALTVMKDLKTQGINAYMGYSNGKYQVWTHPGPASNPPGVKIIYKITWAGENGQWEEKDWPIEPVPLDLKDHNIKVWNAYFEKMKDSGDILNYHATWLPTWINNPPEPMKEPPTMPIRYLGPGKDKDGKTIDLYTDGTKTFKFKENPNPKFDVKPGADAELKYRPLIASQREEFLKDLDAQGFGGKSVLTPDNTITITIPKDQVPVIRNIALKHRVAAMNPIENPRIKAEWAGTIASIQSRDDLTLVDIDYEVEHIKENLGKSKAIEEFGGFFVKIADGDYAEIYGYYGTVPYIHKDIYRITW